MKIVLLAMIYRCGSISNDSDEMGLPEPQDVEHRYVSTSFFCHIESTAKQTRVLRIPLSLILKLLEGTSYNNIIMNKIAITLAIIISTLFNVSNAKVFYRGFVDVTGGIGNCNVIVNTTHGIQISPKLFVGLGLGSDYSLSLQHYYNYGTSVYEYKHFSFDISLRLRTDIPFSNR